MKSSYWNAAKEIEQTTGYSCKGLTDDEMDTVGMADENGWLFWERGNKGGQFASEKECITMYVSGAFQQIGKE